jgi:hypothetical protein
VASPCTLQNLIARILQRANLEGATQFLTPSEVTDMANQSITEWYDLVRLTSFGGQYYRCTAALSPTGTTTPGVGTYALPDNFLSMISVDVFISASQVLTAKPFQEEHRNMFRWYPIGWMLDQPVFYQLQGKNIAFIPVPQSSFSVNLNYCPVPPQLNQPQDTIDDINGWLEWVVLDVAIKALVKDGQTDMIPYLASMKENQAERIRKAAAMRDMYATEQVHEVDATFDGFGGWD